MISTRFGRGAILASGKFRAAREGVAAVEFAFIVPAMLMMMGVIVFAGQGFQIQRKVTLTVRALVDLASQQPELGLTSTTYTYKQILAAAALVMAPTNPTGLSMVLSEVSTNGTTTGTILWSEATGGAAALPVGAAVTIPSNFTASGYLILGAVSYNFVPLNMWTSEAAMTLSDTKIFSTRLPGATGGIVLCTGCP